ncbi:hypothetical protein Tsubulata_041460 [Turnera subulata]|uniref:Uncharacterized protein n=1 Tax=Turnera subulata TaxID=218843 RepID=A0A9Q0EY43_9ROSI|nr:hypothetical protein Tsubulata_041460 [Turnera subulata]
MAFFNKAFTVSKVDKGDSSSIGDGVGVDNEALTMMAPLVAGLLQYNIKPNTTITLAIASKEVTPTLVDDYDYVAYGEVEKVTVDETKKKVVVSLTQDHALVLQEGNVDAAEELEIDDSIVGDSVGVLMSFE